MDNQCKEAIQMTIWACRTMPELFNYYDLINKVCDTFGTEVVADTMIKMGLEAWK